jgi:hypothetical protein
MPNPHTVNERDGLSSLRLIARHYQVPLEALQRRNPHLMNRFAPGHPRRGWLMLGDKILLPMNEAKGQDRVHSQEVRNSLVDEGYWRAFLFVLADEVLPSGKVVRKVLEFPGPTQAEYVQANPEIFGMKPPNPSAPYTLGEHALGHNQSKYLSASTKPGGAPTINGRPVHIDIKKAQAAGAKVHSTEAICADLDRLVRNDPRLKPRVEKLKSVISSVEGEVLLEGSIPARAVKSSASMALTRGFRAVQVIGMAFTIHDVSKAAGKSVQQKSLKPITAEGIRQVGGWAGAVAGSKAGFIAGGLMGIETGPGAILFGAGGALIFGTAGYLGADWLADFVDQN